MVELIRRRTQSRQYLIEFAKRSQREYYQANPIEWMVDRFREPLTNWYWSKWPGYESHEWDGTIDPFARAIQALAEKKWGGIESATSTGKTYIVPRIVYWFLDVFPNSLVVTTAPRTGQLREQLWMEMGQAFGRFLQIREYAEMITLSLVVDKRTKKPKSSTAEPTAEIGHSAIGFVSQVGANEESATKMQGFHRENMLFVLEECAGLPSAILKAVENTSSAVNNLVIALGNPDSQLDALHQFCQLSKVEHITVSAYDHPNVVLSRAVIPGAVTTQSIEFRATEYGTESPFFKSRIRGIAPTEALDSLFRNEYLEQCNVTNPEKFINIELKTGGEFSNALGVDVANSIDGDKACLAWGTGNELNILHEFQCPDANYLAYNMIYEDHVLREMAKGKFFEHDIVYHTNKLSNHDIAHWNIGVDAVGVGVGTINTFRDNKIKVIGLQGGELKKVIPIDKSTNSPLYGFNCLRSQMYFTAMLDLKKGDIRINIPAKEYKALKRELLIITYSVTGGKIGIEPKEQIKKKLGGKSPNMADAFVYWNWVRKNYYRPTRDLPFG